MLASHRRCRSGLLTGHPSEGAQASIGGLADSMCRTRYGYKRAVVVVGAGLALPSSSVPAPDQTWVAALVAGMFAAASFMSRP